MFDNITLTTRPKVDSKLYCKQRKNEASMTVACTISGGLVITFISSALVKIDFFVFNIAPSTWLNDNGTGFCGYDRISAMSTLRSSERNKILPNKSLIRHAEKVLPSPTLIFLVPPSVANEWMV